jgi:hypothetical protein
MRKMATIQLVEEKNPIKGADRIELIRVLGWNLIAKKDEFKVGDKCVFFEIDSQLPVHPIFEFMEKRKYRVKTLKMRGVISQGLALKTDILKEFGEENPDKLKVGKDVSDIIGVTKHDPEGEKEKRIAEATKKHSKFVKFLMRKFPFIRRFLKFKPRTQRFPTEIIWKTDETRIQNMNMDEVRRRDFYEITEKLDGCSSTFIYKKGKLRACSRNYELIKKEDNHYWNIHGKLEKFLKDIVKNNKSLKKETIIIQGEIVGPKIQGNKYELDDFYLYIFNIKLGSDTFIMNADQIVNFVAPEIIKHKFINLVPFIGCFPGIDLTRENLIELSKGNSRLLESQKREGIVLRDGKCPGFSFKVINPEFLLEEK